MTWPVSGTPDLCTVCGSTVYHNVKNVGFTFDGDLPAHALVVKLSFESCGTSCVSGSVKVELNGVTFGQKTTDGDCSCPAFVFKRPSTTFTAHEDYPTGFTGFLYGQTNQLMIYNKNWETPEVKLRLCYSTQ